METETKYFYPGQTAAAAMTATSEALFANDTRGKDFSHTTAAMQEADVKVSNRLFEWLIRMAY